LAWTFQSLLIRGIIECATKSTRGVEKCHATHAWGSRTRLSKVRAVTLDAVPLGETAWAHYQCGSFAQSFSSSFSLLRLRLRCHTHKIWDDAVVVNVPFVFSDGLQNFDAGRYTIRMGDQRIVAIRGESNSGFAKAWFEEYGQPSKTTKVVFRKYGHRSVLSEMWIAGETSHTTVCLQRRKSVKWLQTRPSSPSL
jgi:hypothetical protein